MCQLDARDLLKKIKKRPSAANSRILFRDISSVVSVSLKHCASFKIGKTAREKNKIKILTKPPVRELALAKTK